MIDIIALFIAVLLTELLYIVLVTLYGEGSKWSRKSRFFRFLLIFFLSFAIAYIAYTTTDSRNVALAVFIGTTTRLSAEGVMELSHLVLVLRKKEEKINVLIERLVSRKSSLKVLLELLSHSSISQNEKERFTELINTRIKEIDLVLKHLRKS